MYSYMRALVFQLLVEQESSESHLVALIVYKLWQLLGEPEAKLGIHFTEELLSEGFIEDLVNRLQRK